MEVAELQAALTTHPQVEQAAVAVHDDPFDQPLVAYVVGVPGAHLRASDLREHLSEKVPEAVPPDVFVMVDRLPLTADGCLDRAALPMASRGTGDANTGSVLPAIVAGPTAVVADVWREVLGVDSVNLRDDLYTLGGHSLSITRMAVLIKSRTGIDVPLAVFYDTPTVPGIAAALEDLGAG